MPTEPTAQDEQCAPDPGTAKLVPPERRAKPKGLEVPPSLTLDCSVKKQTLNVGAKGTVAVVLGYCLGTGVIFVALAVAGAAAWKILK